MHVGPKKQKAQNFRKLSIFNIQHIQQVSSIITSFLSLFLSEFDIIQRFIVINGEKHEKQLLTTPHLFQKEIHLQQRTKISTLIDGVNGYDYLDQ